MHTLTNSEDPDEMWHFIRVYTVCQEEEKQFSEKQIEFYLEIITSDPSVYTMDCLKFFLHQTSRKNP